MKQCYKIILAGDGGTGKSTLLNTKMNGKFTGSPKITIGVEFSTLEYHINGIDYTLMVWDLGGQERFQFMHDIYLKGANGGIILYDLTRPATFDHLSHWIDLFRTYCPEIPLILAGSKKDLVTPVETTKFCTELIRWSRTYNCESMIKHHLLISAKNFEGVDEVFEKILSLVSKSDPKDITLDPLIAPSKNLH
jgi:small GTP-binding protein